jgi:microcystin-dependent protein
MIPLKLVMTTAGLGRFTAAQSDAGVDLTVTQVAFTATAFVAAPTLTALPGEFRRVSTVSGEAAGDNLVHMTVQDDAELTYTVRGFGLFLGDGTLFATYSQPGVIVEKSSNAMLALVIDIAFPEAGVDRITFGDTNFLNPPATTERRCVIEIATLEEAKAADPGRAVTGAIVMALIGAALPIGTILLWLGADAPAGWAICNGQAVERSDGAGNITTPDLRDRAPVGAGGSYALGDTFGAIEATAQTDTEASGVSLQTTFKTETAGGGTGKTVATVDVADPGHAHSVTVSTVPPSIALHFIMKV